MGESSSDVANDVTVLDRPATDDAGPQLRLHHLFVLTAVMAVLLAINGPQQQYSSPAYQPSSLLLTITFGLAVVNTILSATALTALGYGTAGNRRGLRFFDQPGHWLLAELSLTALLYIVPTVGYRWIGRAMQANPADPSMVISLVLSGYMLLFIVIGRMAVNFYIGKTICVERRWRYVFYAKAAATILMGLGALIVIPITLSAARIDRREKVPRDSYHWCGVVLQVAESGLMIVIMATTIVNMIAMFRR